MIQKNKHYFYREKGCIKKFRKDLKGLGTEMISFKKKEMIPIKNKKIKSYEKQKLCYICEKKFCDDKNKKSEYELHQKVRDHCHGTGQFRGVAHNICNLRYNVPKKIPIVFHNGSTHDYHFVIIKLVKEFEGEFEYLGENTEKYITFSVPLKKEDDGKITYKLKFIDSYRFMQTSLSNLVDNLSGVYDKECKKCMERKKIRLNCEFIGFKNGRLNYKCKECKKSYTKLANESIKNFPTLYKFCNGDINKFFLLLRKGIYPYEYMDSWERFNENTIPSKEDFYSEFNLENIIDKDYQHVKKVWETDEIKNLVEYYDLYVQCDTFLLADVFENFINKCIKIYKLDPAHFLSAPGLAQQACLKMTKVELELLTDIDMLLIVEKRTRGGICQAIHRYSKANNIYMKNIYKDIYTKILQHHIYHIQ